MNASVDCELRNPPVTQREVEGKFHGAPGKLAADASRHFELLSIFPRPEHLRMRLVLFTRMRDPASDRLRSDVVLAFIVDDRVRRETNRRRARVKAVRCLEVASDCVR